MERGVARIGSNQMSVHGLNIPYLGSDQEPVGPRVCFRAPQREYVDS